MVNFPRSDLSMRVPSWSLTQSPPRNFAAQVHWFQINLESNYTVGSSTVEANFDFRLTNLNSGSQYASLFDQYCIYAVMVRFQANSEYPTSGTLGTLRTAIDYDNSNNLSSWTALADYSSCVTCEVETGASYERYVKPTVAPALYNVNNASLTGYGVGRYWIDSASSGMPHYGLRSYVNGATINYTMLVEFTYIIGVRNNF